jgi:hypothetical protein
VKVLSRKDWPDELAVVEKPYLLLPSKVESFKIPTVRKTSIFTLELEESRSRRLAIVVVRAHLESVLLL